MKPQVPCGEGSIDQKVTRGFATTKKPLSQRRTTGWNNKLRFLSPSLAYFPMHINSSSLDLFRVQILRENTLLRVSSLFFLNHFRVCDFVHLYLGFEADIEDLAH